MTGRVLDGGGMAAKAGTLAPSAFSGALLWRSGVPRLEGAWALSCGRQTPRGTPKISRSGPARE